MISKLIIALLFLVSHICADAEPALAANGTVTLDFDSEENINNSSQTQNPIVPPIQKSTASSTSSSPTTVFDDSEDVFPAAINATIEQLKDKPEVLIGETHCDSKEICESINSSHCKEGVCECLETHVPNLNNTGCLKIATKNENTCEIETQCKTFNSKCVNQKCIIEEELKKSPTSGVLSKTSSDNGSTSGTQIYLSLLVLNMAFLIYN